MKWVELILAVVGAIIVMVVLLALVPEPRHEEAPRS